MWTSFNIINNHYPNSKIYYVDSKNPNKKLVQNKQNLITFDNRNLNSSLDKNNSFFNSKNSDMTKASTTRREREIDKKVKNIFFNKNILNRHKNSPYLKSFNDIL